MFTGRKRMLWKCFFRTQRQFYYCWFSVEFGLRRLLLTYTGETAMKSRKQLPLWKCLLLCVPGAAIGLLINYAIYGFIIPAWVN